MWRRFIVLGVLACAVGMFASAPAFAASPQQVYRDYADNGRLDHQYSKADLQRALKYAALQGYSKVGVQGAVQPALGAQPVKTTGGLCVSAGTTFNAAKSSSAAMGRLT